MWESLGTTWRQDRLLHGAAKALNILLGLVLLPAWLLGQRLAGPLRRLLGRAAEPAPLPAPLPAPHEMASVMEELESIPGTLRPSAWAEVRKGLADISPFVVTQNHDGAIAGYAYPHQFHDVVFDGADGISIGASVALHDEPRPGLLVVHGLFSTRRFD